jgi:hypothetical protein
MRIFLILIIVLTLGWAPARAQGVTATPDLSQLRPPDAVDVLDIVGKLYGRTLTLLQAEFPNDYAVLAQRIAEIDAQPGTETVLLLASFEAFTELRRKYADRLLFAPSLNHSVMLGRIADFHDLVFAGEGAATCGRFAQDGSGVLFERGLAAKYAVAIDLQSLAYFEAVVAAIESPDPSAVASPEDWGMVLGTMIAAGAPQIYVTAISGGDPNDPNLCPALAAMFRTAGLLDTPEGKRTRADFAKNLSGY